MQIYVGIPSGTGRPYPDVIMSVYNQTCFKDHEIFFTSENIVSHMPVEDARNVIMQRFLRSKCDYLWFIDDDNPPMPDVLERLLSHELDFVSALVPIRHGEKYLLNVFIDKKHVTSTEGLEPLLEITNCGAACVLISQKLAKEMYLKHNGIPYQFKQQDYICTNDDEIVKYEHQDRYETDWMTRYKIDDKGNVIVKSEKISEDLFFGQSAKENGYKIYADLEAKCYHYKNTSTKLLVKNETINHSPDDLPDQRERGSLYGTPTQTTCGAKQSHIG